MTTKYVETNGISYAYRRFGSGELINDKMPNTPSRKVPPQFAARVAIGAVLGTLGGAHVRSLLARAFAKDLPAALTEGLVAIVAVVVIVTRF